VRGKVAAREFPLFQGRASGFEFFLEERIGEGVLSVYINFFFFVLNADLIYFVFTLAWV
jgi:hypothetical protein